jgi:hypothetical protein
MVITLRFQLDGNGLALAAAVPILLPCLVSNAIESRAAFASCRLHGAQSRAGDRSFARAARDRVIVFEFVIDAKMAQTRRRK